jgi:hypothetical protein
MKKIEFTNKTRIGILWKSWGDLHSLKDFFLLECGRNVGNRLYVHAIDQLFNGTRIPWHSNAKQVNENFDVLIFPAANQLGDHTDLQSLGELWSQYDVPIICIGLGIQGNMNQDPVLKEGTKYWLNVLINNSNKFNNNIFVRGEKTQSFIEKYFKASNIKPVGCPSQFLMDKYTIEILKNKKKFEKVLVYGSGYGWNHTKIQEKEMLSELMKSNGKYVLNSPLASYLAGCGDFSENETIEYLKKFYNSFGEFIETSVEDWFKKYAYSFVSFDDSISYPCNFDYSIGFRIHGCISSLLSGTPSVLLPMDSRTMELAETLSVPYILENDNIIDGAKQKLLSFDYDKMFDRWTANFRLFTNTMQGVS